MSVRTQPPSLPLRQLSGEYCSAWSTCRRVKQRRSAARRFSPCSFSAAPAGGKGTQAGYLADRYGPEHSAWTDMEGRGHGLVEKLRREQVPVEVIDPSQVFLF